MAISPKCHRCGAELEEPGGLLFSPPVGAGMVVKYHLCAECFEIVLGGIARDHALLRALDDGPEPEEGI